MIVDRITRTVRKLWKDTRLAWMEAEGASGEVATIWNLNIVEGQ